MKKELQPWCNSKSMIKNTGQNTNHQPFKIPAAILALNLPTLTLLQVNDTVASHLSQAARMPATEAQIASVVDNHYPELQAPHPESKLRRQMRVCARVTILLAITETQVEVEVFGGEEYAKDCENRMRPTTGAGVSVTTEKAIADAVKNAEEERERKRRQEELQRVLEWLSDCAAALRCYELQECEKLARRLAERLQLLLTEPVREP